MPPKKTSKFSSKKSLYEWSFSLSRSTQEDFLKLMNQKPPSILESPIINAISFVVAEAASYDIQIRNKAILSQQRRELNALLKPMTQLQNVMDQLSEETLSMIKNSGFGFDATDWLIKEWAEKFGLSFSNPSSKNGYKKNSRHR